MNTQLWLASVDRYGNASLVDGPHSDHEGVEQALYLLQRLGLAGDRKFAMATVSLEPIEAKAHDVNEEALSALNSIGLK